MKTSLFPSNRACNFARICFLLLCLSWFLVLPASAAGKELYRYTDKRGVIHFVDDLEKVPAEYRRSAKKVDASISVIGKEEEEKEEKEPGLIKKLLGSLPFLRSLAGDEEALSEAGSYPPPGSVSELVLLEAVRSRVWLPALWALAVLALLPAGWWLARDVPRKPRRRRYRALLLLSATGALVCLWFALAAPAALRFAQSCQERAGQSLSRKELNPEVKEDFRNLQKTCARWEGTLKKLLLTGGENQESSELLNEF